MTDTKNNEYKKQRIRKKTNTKDNEYEKIAFIFVKAGLPRRKWNESVHLLSTHQFYIFIICPLCRAHIAITSYFCVYTLLFYIYFRFTPLLLTKTMIKEIDERDSNAISTLYIIPSIPTYFNKNCKKSFQNILTIT